jgi:hypothetical protein
MTAWPGGPFKHLTVLRRRRNELEYPAFSGEHIEIAEVKSAIDTARSLVSAAEELAEHPNMYT